ncbi:MAG TPA: peptidylprolyl isomerase [Sphingomicrobium sp.]|nr:peptidylprolyl isomerase [Sphingomicrobium sp.]
MKQRILLALVAAALAAPALAQATPEPATASNPQAELVPVAIDTSLGRIVIGLDKVRAPVTTANFLKYVDGGRFNGESFYRAMRVPDGKGGEGGLIQGGIRSDARKLLPPVAHEPTSQTGLRNVAGAISMANAGPGTARADFFILVSDQPGLDAGGPGGDANGFAVFGRVLEGMDVVRKIFDAPVNPDKGEGPMKGQMLEPAIKIVKAERMKS